MLAEEVQSIVGLRIEVLLADWSAQLGGGAVQRFEDAELWWAVDLAEGVAYARVTFADAAVREDDGCEGLALFVEILDASSDVVARLAPSGLTQGHQYRDLEL